MGKLKQDRNYTYKVTGKKIHLEFIQLTSHDLVGRVMEMLLPDGTKIEIDGDSWDQIKDFAAVVDQAAVAGGTWEDVVKKLPDYF